MNLYWYPEKKFANQVYLPSIFIPIYSAQLDPIVENS